jgi:hypothetical protein
MSSAVTVHRRRWINYAACVWALLFAAPHIWWALGFPAGIPGGAESHRLMMTTWRYYFDVGVIFLCFLAVFVALAPVRPWGGTIPRWVLLTMAWIASAVLMLRGVAGLVVDGSRDPVWWPTFLAGGILFACVAGFGQRPGRTTDLDELPEDMPGT